MIKKVRKGHCLCGLTILNQMLYYFLRAAFTVLAMFSAERPNSLRRSTAGPECPNSSFTPIFITGTGQQQVTASATAEPRPPMMLCSSAVTIRPVSLAHLQISSLSRGLIVWIFTTRESLQPLQPRLP